MRPLTASTSINCWRNADLALYGAKSDGRRTYRFFQAGMDRTPGATQPGARAAPGDRRSVCGFELHYQPLLHLEDGRVSCCEALLRWRHPARGTISPADFIPVAEYTGLIDAARSRGAQHRAYAEAVSAGRVTPRRDQRLPVQFKSAERWR